MALKAYSSHNIRSDEIKVNVYNVDKLNVKVSTVFISSGHSKYR